MKTAFLIIGISLAMLFMLTPSVHAQDIGLSITQGEQDLFGSYLPINLSLTSKGDIGQVKVQWIVPYGVETEGGSNGPYEIGLTEDNIYNDHLVIQPQFQGTYPITADVSGVYNGVPFDRNATVDVHVDGNLHVTDNASSYDIKKILFVLADIAAFIVFALLAGDVFGYGKNRFLSWLNKEDKV